ncbi:MAG TPA: alpha/beta fold hydrolase [Kiritimatiellia bacterium]|nr:alpha/beta fold hydrolase [Kiritimatiellia bacterium]
MSRFSRRISFSNHWKKSAGIFQSLENTRVLFPIIGIGLLGLAATASAQTDFEKVTNAVHTVRLELEAALGKPVPSLSLLVQTPADTFFTCSAATPEQAVATNTTFRFASNTKNFTATAVLHMQQQGWLDISDPITNTIPGFSEPYIPTGTNWAIPNKPIITIEQLLRHSAGVYDVDNDDVPGCGGTSYTDYMITLDPAHQFTVEEMAGQAALHQLSYSAPDEGYHYSNTGYAMLAEIVGRIYSLHSGSTKKLTDYLYDHIIGGASPVPIPEIHFPNLATDTALPEPFMWGTERRPTNITIIVSNCNMSAQVGEGNGYGTLPALNRFIRATMKGEGVLSHESVRLMQTDTSPLNAGYALGCTFVTDLGFGHNGCRVGNLSHMNYNPETDVSVAVYLPLVDYSDNMDSFTLCFQAIYNAAYRALEALGYPRTPTLAHGSQTNLTLSAGATNTFYFTAAQGAFYGVKISNTVADIFCRVAPGVDPDDAVTVTNNFTWQGHAPGTYRLDVSSTAATECALSLIALKMPDPSDFSALNWTNAFIAAHDVFSRQYAFGDWKSVDWGALYSNTLPRIAAAQALTNEVAYYAALHEYVGSVPDGHVALKGTNAAVPAAWGEEVAGGGYGLAVAELDDGRVIAAALLTHGPAQLAGMEAGAEIVSWDGLAPASAMAQINAAAYPLRALAGPMTSCPQATLAQQRLEQARLLVRGPVGTTVDVQFINPGSLATQAVALTATADTNATFALLDFAMRQNPSSDPVEYRLMTNGLGYLLIRFEANFAEPENLYVINSNVAEAVKFFVASNAPGVIVDVRGNLGGDDQLAATLCGYFHRTNMFYERQTWYNTLNGTFTELTFDSMNGWAPLDYMAIPTQSVFYGGPVAVLVNLGTVSSGEGVAMGIGALPNARVIGFHGTHGSFGMAGATIALPGGYSIHYPFGQSLDENGVIQLDSRNGVGGVPPEIRIPKSAENVLAFAAGTDVELNYASDYLIGLRNYTNTIAQTTALITNLMAQHDIPALSIALVDGANIVWAQGFGTANREAGTPASADTIYRIASCSKTFAAASIMRLQDDGLLTLQDDVTNTVPAFSLLPRYPDQALTIRELLAHQAQLPGCYFRHADSTIPYDGYYDMSLALMVEDYLVEPRHFLQKYNNNGFTLIEGVVAGANTNGLDYAAFAITNLFQPMGMSNTTFRLADHQTNLLAKVYRSGVLAPDEFVNTPGSGGAYSTAADMARYARFLLGYGTFNGTRILSSNAVAALWADQSAQVALVNKEDYAKSGLGWDQIADPSFAYAGRMAWKDGDSLNYSAIICVMPEHGLAAVALNSIPGADTAAAPAAKLALKLALQERDGIPLPSTNPPAFPVSPVTVLTEQELAGIIGTYSAAGGYDLVTGTVSAITWITGADGSSPVRYEGLVPHQDGWFSATNAPEFRLSFTNIGGRVILRSHVRYEEYLRIIAQAERFTPAPLSAAWSNRVGKTWITADLEPESYLWLLGFYPTLELGMADGVLSVYSSPCQTLQPQGDDLAFPFSMNAAQPSALQVKHTNGHEVIRYSGYDFRRVDDLPVLQPGQSATGLLAAGASAPFQFSIADPVWHGIHISPSNLILRQATADLSAPGTYSLILQNPGTSAAPYSLRLYNLTSTIARVSTLITNLMATHQLVGCGISLVDGDQTVWQTGFGYADRERGRAADARTPFMIGSISKTFGALAAMQLAEEGLLDLHASITNALPSFAIHQRFADNTITPHTILTHHSGLPGDVFNQGFTVRPLPGVPDAVQAMLANEYALMPTNTMWAYNNSGFVMLGQMFRHLTGQELDVFARARLFDRMGMTNSSIAFDLPAIRQTRARPYVGGQIGPDEYVNLYFAGAIYSTAADMARYMRMLLAGGMGENARVVSNQTLQAMATRQNAGIALDQYASMLNMGIGFVLDPPNLRYMGKVLWHDGGTVYFRSLLRVATEAQLGCFISCNSYEGGAMTYTVVDSALQWAYEEKTGLAPPAPLDPGAPGGAVAPPEVITLATGGVFVTSGGYDTFRYDGTNLFARFNAQLDESPESAWTYRENGWFTPTNAYAPQLEFVQVEGRILSVIQTFDYAVTNLILLGERAAGLAPFHPAWSNRLGRWWATDLHPDDIAWHGDDLRLAWPALQLTARDNMLLVQVEDLYVMSATNDALAFAAGLGRNKGSSLRAAGPDAIAYMGVHYRAEAGIPQLAPGASTNGSTLGDEIQWFQIPAAAASLTFDLATEHDLAAYLYTEDDEYLGQANRSHALHLDATNAQPVMAAILRNGTNTGPWTLATYTNAIPFYSQVPADEWPAALAAHSNLFPNTDFGHVFARENRERGPGVSPVLKIALARMKSPNPSPRPLFFLNGGPGDSGIRCAYQYFLKAFTGTHDVYLIDPRGVSYSQPSLDFFADEDLPEWQYRLTMLQQADLSALNTLESSHDVDDIAAAFGVAEADLIGQSYGTLLAQTVMRREPAWLRSVILDGVVAPNIPGLSQAGPVRNEALENLFADVAAHPQASVWYPAFGLALHTLSTNLQNNPVDLVISGETNQMNGLSFLDAVFNQLTSTDLAARERIPNIVWRATRGETAALAELLTEFRKDTNLFMTTCKNMEQQILVIKHDFLPFDSLEAASNACANLPPLVARTALDFMTDAIEGAALFDDYGQADNAFTNPVTVSIPTLVINGTYDTQTGTNWAAEVARHLPNAHYVAPPAVGHGVLFATNGCMTQLFRDFLADPTNPPDTSCLAGLVPDFPPPWPANTRDVSVGQTFTNAFEAPDSAQWNRFTAVSGVVYTVTQTGGDALRVVDENANTLASVQNEAVSWESSGDGRIYLMAIASRAGTNSITLDLPLLFRHLAFNGQRATLNWQSLTNLSVNLWMITNLGGNAEPICVHSNIAAQGWFTTLDHEDETAHPSAFYFLKDTE